MEKKMKSNKLLLLLFIYLIFFSACKGPIGLTGAAGLAGGRIPGGALAVTIDATADADTAIVIAFDPDEIADSGNEQLVIIPLGDYVVAGNVNRTFVWNAPSVSPGTYYVYAWVDTDLSEALNDESYTTGEVFVYDFANDYGYDEVDRIGSTNSTLTPNYTFWTDYAPDIDISL